MPRFSARRAVALLALTLLAGAAGGCRDQRSGETRVVVIGDQPRLRDPSAGPLSAGDALVTASLAQGLVSLDPGGNVVAGLAERWNVSDDGLSYIFRITAAKWSDGRKVTAQQVARALKRAMSDRSRNALRDTLGAVEDVIAMTDRVIEIRLASPRPNLLTLLAQPEFVILRSGHGTGPFSEVRTNEKGWLKLEREIASNDEDEASTERVLVKGTDAKAAIAGFAAGDSDLLLGGTFDDLPLAQRVKLPRGALRFDPASGLFGLAPVARGRTFDKAAIRLALSRAIDRDGFIAALGVPGLAPRTTVLEPSLEGGLTPVIPAWAALPADQRRAQAAASAGDLLDGKTVRVFLPTGSGSDLLLNQLTIDWGALGLKVERAPSPRGADFVLVDEVAPSASPAWFVRRFRCAKAPVCDPEADQLLDAARAASVPAQRIALLAQAAALIDDKALFIPLSAPVRWSLVGDRIAGFRPNRFARHTLVGLRDAANSRN